jgi:catechol-2,3-dioxygenase
MERSTKFWTDVMGFKFSDKNEHGMAFFRNATDHHTVALIQAKEKNDREAGQVGFDHMALEVATVSSFSKSATFQV